MSMTADGYPIRNRIQMSTQIRLVYQKNGKPFDYYYTRVGRVIMRACLPVGQYKTVEDKLNAALVKMGQERDCEVFAKGISDA